MKLSVATQNLACPEPAEAVSITAMIDIPYDGPNYLQSVYDTIVIAIWSVVVGICTRSPVPSWKADQSETVGSCICCEAG